MNGCKRCCEINTVSLIYRSVQVLREIMYYHRKIDGWKWYRHITDFFQYIHVWKQGGIVISTYDISLLLFCSAKTSKFEGTSGCSYSFIIQKEPFIKWMAATRIANQLNTLEKMDGCKCLFQRNRVPLKILDHFKWFPEIMAVLLKCITASAPLK